MSNRDEMNSREMILAIERECQLRFLLCAIEVNLLEEALMRAHADKGIGMALLLPVITFPACERARTLLALYNYVLSHK